ncbi:MAG TPA: hypothetical protein EYG57_02275 [Planctomycetes bacterium]|nr:hypothetical protein [Planctomycetaceae bacterium]HIM28364.1 hypothetical protein [Planctomycetota bacterium]
MPCLRPAVWFLSTLRCICFVLAWLSVLVATLPKALVAEYRDGQTVTYHGYPNSIVLRNASTQVVLCPEAGGRVLEFSRRAVNSLYLEEADTGKPYVQGGRASMSAGRFDIGPEKTIPRHSVLWSGRWKGEVTGPRRARLTSQKDDATGVRLVRDFELGESNSYLKCTQTIVNISKVTNQWCHWSRTFAIGEGICVIPLSKPSRFPKSYVMYETGDLININPTDENIRSRDGFLEILAAPARPKLGMDSTVGWFAYLMPNDLMFVKRFQVDPNRVYNEAAGLTISIWYPPGKRVELEPIGPRETLRPGESASFTEHWWLLDHTFPADRKSVSLKQVANRVERDTTTVK